MTDWFRSWHGAPTDPKWLGIAKRAGVAPGIAVSVAWALMDRASQACDRGSIDGYDADGLACFFGCEPEQVDAIVSAMSDKGMIADGRFASWERRQPKREDDSAKRVQEHRKRKADAGKRAVTHGNAPDTETETETEETTPSGVVSAAPPASGLDDLQSKLLDAVGEGNIQPHGAIDLSAIIGLQSAGVDLDTDILPTIRAKASRLKRPAGSWAYFTDAIRDAYSRRIEAGQGLARPKVSEFKRLEDMTEAEARARWAKVLSYNRGTGIWRTWLDGPPPGRDGCRVPADMLESQDLKKDWFEEKAA